MSSPSCSAGPCPGPPVPWTDRVTGAFHQANVFMAHLPPRLVVCLVCAGVLYLGWCWIGHERIMGSLRRLVLSGAAGLVAAGIGVGWVSANRHAGLAATAKASKTQVREILAWGWGGSWLAATVLFFAVATMVVRARENGRFGGRRRPSRQAPRRRGAPRRGAPRGRPVSLPPGFGGLPGVPFVPGDASPFGPPGWPDKDPGFPGPRPRR